MRVASKILGIFTFLFSLASFAAAYLGLAKSPVQYEYVLLLCAVAALLSLLPALAFRLFNLQVPEFIKLFLYTYIICGILLGNVYDFYYQVPLWDKLLHFFSGVLLMFSGIILLDIFTKKGYIRFNKAFTIIVALLFAVTVGTLWEFVEYGIDCLLNVNMQRYMLPDGTLLYGQEALHDSMQDMLAAFFGATITSIGLALRLGSRSRAAHTASISSKTAA